MTWSAAILVGGAARRLRGRAKPLLDVGGRTILDRQTHALATLGVKPTLVTNDPSPFARLGFRTVPDALPGGALAGLYTALFDATTPHVLVLAGDLPFVTAPFLATLLARRHDVDAVVPRRDGRWHPLCAVYDRRVSTRVHARLLDGRWRVTDLLDDLRVCEITEADLAAFDSDGRLLMNVNTPDDHASATDLATLER
jgi:molybdenum cofactor guanylyltransferase